MDSFIRIKKGGQNYQRKMIGKRLNAARRVRSQNSLKQELLGNTAMATVFQKPD